MPEPIAVRMPQVNVNDEYVTIISWQIASGDRVEKGQYLLEVDTSKSAVEIEASESGYVHYTHQPDTEVAVGAVLYYLSAEPVFTKPEVEPPPTLAAGQTETPHLSIGDIAAPMAVSEPEPQTLEPPRFSVRARALMEAHAVKEASFAGKGLVRDRDVLHFLQKPAAPVTEIAPAVTGARTATPAEGVPVRAEPLSRQKLMEARLLAPTNAGALNSSVTVSCPTRGLRRAAARETALRGNATALIVFEAARLLRQFPVFNAYQHEQQVCYYERVNIGFAVDAGRGLKVLVVPDADTKTADAIADEMHELVGQYLEDRLPLKALSGGTFTITDLSGEGVHDFQPLINQGQSAILGIGAESVSPRSQDGAFHLVLTFDHRLSEGRTAAQFLNALRGRLSAHEAALTAVSSKGGHAGSSDVDLYCGRCMRTAQQLTRLEAYLVRSAVPEEYLCSLCLRGF